MQRNISMYKTIQLDSNRFGADFLNVCEALFVNAPEMRVEAEVYLDYKHENSV